MFNVVVEIKAPEITEAIWALIGTLTNAKIESTIAQTLPTIPIVLHEQSQQQQVETQQQPMQIVYPEQQYPALGYATQPLQQPQQAPMQQMPIQQPMQPQQPMQQTSIQQQAPAQQMQPQQIPTNIVPTTAPSYTLEQLAVAATQLMDAGRRAELLTLLSAFGIQALTMLPKEQYGNFATQLRSLGVKI